MIIKTNEINIFILFTSIYQYVARYCFTITLANNFNKLNILTKFMLFFLSRPTYIVIF